MLIGPNDLKQIFLPSAIDGAVVHEQTLPTGIQIGTLLADINDALTIAHDTVMNDPVVQSLISTTTDADVEYPQGARGGFEESTEYGEPDAQRADTGGHMLPLRKFDRALEWSKDYLEVARQVKLDADVSMAAGDYEELIWRRMLQRLTSSVALTGKRYGLGNGKSVPFCDGGACGEVYVPVHQPSRGFIGEATHTHFLRLSGKTQANVEAVATHLWEHGHNGPFDMLVSDADADEWMNKAVVTGFRERAASLVTQGANDSVAQVDDSFLGVIITKRGTVRVRALGRFPSGYWNMHKSYGALDPRNPLRYRYSMLHGEGPYFDVPAPKSLPVEGALIRTHGDFGVGEDRTNSVNVLDAVGGAYIDPTIS